MRRGDRKNADFQNGGLKKVGRNLVRTCSKTIYSHTSLFFSENKVHILIPWHPFDIKINFIEFRMSGISKFRSKYKTGSTRFSSAREALSTSQKIDSSEYHCWIITIINVFLCQSDKERHVRIGEVFISPILKLFRQTCWITSRLIDHVGGRESPNYVTRQHRRITHQTHDDIVLR